MTSLLPVAASLLLVVGTILGLAFLLRRLPGAGRAGAGAMRIKAALAVGPRERVVWIEAGGQQLLLGVTAQNIRTVHAFATPPEEAATPPAPAFAEQLRTLLGKPR